MKGDFFVPLSVVHPRCGLLAVSCQRVGQRRRDSCCHNCSYSLVSGGRETVAEAGRPLQQGQRWKGRNLVRAEISDRGPSLHVLRTTRAGRLRPRVLHGRGVEGRAPKSCGRCEVEGKGLRVLRTSCAGRLNPRILHGCEEEGRGLRILWTPCAGGSNPRILHGLGRKVEERRREDAELRDGRGGFLPAVTCGRSCARGLPRRSRDRGSAGRGPSRPSP